MPVLAKEATYGTHQCFMHLGAPIKIESLIFKRSYSLWTINLKSLTRQTWLLLLLVSTKYMNELT